NYLVPVDANVSTPNELTSNSLRLVDLMATLESIPSRMRIVLLDACRNNPFPGVNDAGRGLAIVDAPNGSIVGYSTAPGPEALDRGLLDRAAHRSAGGLRRPHPVPPGVPNPRDEPNPADRAAVQARAPGCGRLDRRPADSVGKLVADL